MSESARAEIKPPVERDVSRLTRQVDELIPMLAHGFTQQIQDKGLRGKVQIHAVAGGAWAIGTSQDNTYGVPNVITYPQDYLATTDLQVVNARLRHEVGNLNYPFEEQLTELAVWAKEQGIPPQVVTTLAQAIHGPSVDYLEMRNSHSSAPQENFRAMYETEIDVRKIAATIGERAPYRQVLDIIYLEGLAAAGIVSREVVDTAIQGATPEVQAVITPEMEEQIAEAVKTSNPRRKAAMVREFLFPQLSQLATLDTQASEDKPPVSSKPDLEAQMQQVKEQLQKLKEQMKKKSDPQRNETSQQNQSEKQRGQQLPQKEMSPEEQQEQQQAKNLLEESLRESLQDIKEQFQQKYPQQSPTSQEPAPQSMQEIGEQAQQMKDQLEQKLQDAQQTSQDQQIAEQLEKLKEQLEQLQEVAQQLSETARAEAAEDEESMTYNIKEYGIDESKLSPEQMELLGKVRTYAQNTSKTYRSAMRVLMTAYQQHNPNFTDEIMQKMKDRGYDLPDFSIYGPESAQEFLSQQVELGIDSIQSEDFLVNFNLPRPIGRMWYRGGNGSRSIFVPEGAIEWGDFYRRTMPVIWNAADRAAMTDKLYLDRLNQFGQHDAKRFYYLYDAANMQAMDDQSNEPQDQKESQQSDSQDGQPGQGEMGNVSPQEIQDLMQQVQQMLNEAKGQGGQQGSQPGQDVVSQMQEELQQLMEQIQQLQQQAGQQNSQPGSQNGQQSSEGEVEREGEGQQGAQSQQGQDGESGKSGQPGEGQSGEGTPGESDSQSSGEPQEQSHETFQQGGSSNERAVQSLFSNKNNRLLKQLEELSSELASKFTEHEETGFGLRRADESIGERVSQQQKERVSKTQSAQIAELERIKSVQQKELAKYYQEMSGLDGQALDLYVEYMASMEQFIDDVLVYFRQRFQLDQDYQMSRDQLHGSRLQKGWQENILGSKDGKPLLRPTSFERRLNPHNPTILWTLIIDNSGSCSGPTIEEEKKFAVGLIEVSRELNIPLEILTFGGLHNFTFLKTHDQTVSEMDLQKIVLLQADQGTPDVETLEAACASMRAFSDQYRTSNSFVYFMTDGQSEGAGRTIEDVIKDYRRDMVITGIGLGPAAGTIQTTWGKNALAVPDVSKLSQQFLDKIEDQIEETFD